MGSSTILPTLAPTKTGLMIDALKMAVCRRKPAAGLVHHSDCGPQYTALSFGKKLEEAGIASSMGRAGSALNNTDFESFVSPLKCKLVHRRRFPTRDDARSLIFEYPKAFYNRRMLQSVLGYASTESYVGLNTKEVAVA